MTASPSPVSSRCCPVVELRQYVLHPGMRDALVTLFDRELVEPQEELGIQVIAHNISRSGAGFVTQQQVQPGESVRLYLQGQGSLSRMDEGLVMRCRAYKDGWFEVGLKFAGMNEIAGPDLETKAA